MAVSCELSPARSDARWFERETQAMAERVGPYGLLARIGALVLVGLGAWVLVAAP